MAVETGSGVAIGTGTGVAVALGLGIVVVVAREVGTRVAFELATWCGELGKAAGGGSGVLVEVQTIKANPAICIAAIDFSPMKTFTTGTQLAPSTLVRPPEPLFVLEKSPAGNSNHLRYIARTEFNAFVTPWWLSGEFTTIQ